VYQFILLWEKKYLQSLIGGTEEVIEINKLNEYDVIPIYNNIINNIPEAELELIAIDNDNE
jgi:hypothetical protein